MSDETYQVIFHGRIQEGLSSDAVKADFARTFKLDSGKAEKMFSGRPIVLRSGLSREQASKYEKAILKTGAECLVLREQGKTVPVKTARAAAAAQPVPPGNAAQGPPAGLTDASRDFSSLLDAYRPKCVSPFCRLAPDIAGDLADEIDGIWEKVSEKERILAWFEIKRHPDKVYGMLLTDRHLHVRGLGSGKRSIPIGETGQIQIGRKKKTWELEFGVSNLYHDIPSKMHEPLEAFLNLCREAAGLEPAVAKRTVAETKAAPTPKKQKGKSGTDESETAGSGSDAGMAVVMTIGMLVMIGINMELLMSAGGGIIMSFVFSLALILLTPTVIGLVIAAWFIGLVADLPTFALVLRTLTAVLVGCVVVVALAYPLGLMKGGEKKDPDNTKSEEKNKG
ncbi:MAG: hypothetical protein ACOZBW_03840 [Thermodesulfobacteriota bacterium]